ncbi:MAG: hypothetical protein GY773_30485 [Actinomycetia bacterium]|nr:hypothetical protein [Actinomycetes bacterium]MCP5033137.1 hypothetical protein [Actinomycetes bacterium]
MGTEAEAEVDLDQWLELASSGLLPHETDHPPVDIEAVVELKKRLSRVLAGDEHAMMAPASLGAVDDAIWASMPAGQRAKFTRMQLRKLDPRLLSRVIATWTVRRSIRSGY